GCIPSDSIHVENGKYEKMPQASCKLARVNKEWRAIVDSDQIHWKERILLDGYVLDEPEETRALPKLGNSEFDDDEDEYSNLTSANHLYEKYTVNKKCVRIFNN
ncbi:4688_t:CDS:2, partial [Entrophospora sp. SA101]